jgi:hypothetical protein
MQLIYHHIYNKYSPWPAIFSLCILTLIEIGCKKLVTVAPPVTSITDVNVFNTDATAASVLTGIYTNMSSGSFATGVNGTSISLLCGLSADEFTLYNGTTNEELFYYTNALSNINVGSDLWSNIYPTIYAANAAVQGLTNNNHLTPSVQQQLMGEALFIRAFCYFYLVNLYGDVPLVTGTDYTVNDLLSRTPKTYVYQQMISDLKEAQVLLSSNYLESDAHTAYPFSSLQRVRPTKWAADALLARTYLYTGDYTEAVILVDSVISNNSLFNLDQLNQVFLKNSTEAIWQLQPVNNNSGITNTADAYQFIVPSDGPDANIQSVYISPYLLNSFEVGDQRRLSWLDSVIVGKDTFYYPYKYKVNAQNAPVTEYLMVLRLGEQYLIRAESEAHGVGNGISAAITDLNVIRFRALLPPYSGDSDQTSVLNAIYHERQVELFSEWGHRWFDLKRTGNVDSVMGVPGNVCRAKGGTWDLNWQLYPIALTELQYDPKLVQNPGY